MRAKRALWFWGGVWGVGLLLGLAISVLYAWLPVDGATGDLESFGPEGFRVQWLLEERQGGLRVGDVIVRAGGHTLEEWLEGAPPGPEWRTGGIVTYEIVRDGQTRTLDVRLAPASLRAVLVRWMRQLAAALACLLIGTFVFLSRPQAQAARLLMLFCLGTTLQYWGDAYNFQYATLPWRWPFWFHLIYEHGVYSLTIGAIFHFALVFPVSHPLIKRLPRLIPFLAYGTHPLVVAGAMVLSSGWVDAVQMGSRASWVVALVQISLGIAAGIRSARTARDPVKRAQIRWILWSAGLGVTVLFPGYVLPLLLGSRPLLPHPVMMIFIALIPFSIAIAILRHRLFDIEIIINRTLVYGTLTALLAGLYLLLVRGLSLLVQGLLRWEDETLAVFLATMCIALAFAPLRQRVQALIDRAFYRTKLDYQQLLPEMSGRLATSIVPDQLAALLTTELPGRLQIAWATLAVLDPGGERMVLLDDADGGPALAMGHPLISYLRTAGRPLIRLQPTSDVPAAAQAFLDQHGIELSIPLMIGGELVGMYNLGPKLSGYAYNHDEVRLLHLLSQQAAVAVENSRLFQATERQAEELAILHQAAVAIASSLEVEEVLRELAERLGRSLDVTSVYICDLDDDCARCAILAEWVGPQGTGREPKVGETYDMARFPTLRQALLEGRPLARRATDPTLDPASREEAEQYGWESFLVMPLVVRGGVIGFAELWETGREREFSPAEVRLCRTLAADAATAIERARLFQGEREQRELAEALEAAAAVVSSTLDLDQVLDRILEQVERVVAGDAFNIMLLEGADARVVRWRGYERLGVEDRIARFCVPALGFPNLASMMRTGQPVVTSDTRADPGWVLLDGWEWLRSFVSAPIRVAERAVGFLNVDGTRPGQFCRADAFRLEAFANHAAAAIENAKLYQETAHHLARTRVLRAVMLAAASTLDFDQVLERTVETLQTGMGIEFLGFALPDAVEGGLRYHPSQVGYPLPPELGLLPLEGSVCGRVFRTGEPVLVRDAREVPDYYGRVWGMRSEVAVPVRVGGRTIGVLNLESRSVDAFDENDLAFYSAIAGQLGVALENARLYEEVRRHADELTDAVAKLQELDRLKSEFIQNVSHELRSPLALIRGYAELLAGGDLGALSPDQRGPISIIVRRSRMLSDLVEDITLILLAEARALEWEPVPLDELARLALDDFRVAVDRAQLTLTAQIADDLPPVWADSIRLRRVLDNLLSNAVKFTPAGGTVTLRIWHKDASVILQVSDTGIGIPPQEQERIFDRFYQVDGSSQRRYSGVGLGLALVRELVEALGGEVDVESEPGRGATFTVILPAWQE